MKLLWLALAPLLLAGCAVVPAPYPYAAPGVSVGIGIPAPVPVYRRGYRQHHHGHYGHPSYGHYYGRRYYRGW